MKESKDKLKIKISPYTIINAGISICVVVTLIFTMLAVFSYYKYFEAKKRFNQKNSRLLTLEKDAKDLEVLIKQYKEERARLQELLFTDKDIATFLDMISDFAKTAQVSIKDMKAQRFQRVNPPDEIIASLPPIKREAFKKQVEKETGPMLYSLPIRMSIEGDFEHVINFLISLEKYRQLLTLSNVSIRRKGYPILDCKFTIRLYSLKELEELTK